MLSSIKTPITVIAVLAILCSSVFTFVISLQEHENLYRESVKQDLDGLSDNLSNDLVNMLANNAMDFELATILLRLDRYENVKFAAIFNQYNERISFHKGKSKATTDNLSELPISEIMARYPLGMTAEKDNLIALKVIGDKRFPLGYLLIVNDLAAPLLTSKNQMLSNAITSLLVVIAVSIICIYLLLSGLLAPLSKLSKFANQVRKTQDYQLRPDAKGRYEIARLSKNISAMMSTVDEQMEKNKEFTRQLIDQQRAMERLANFDSLTGLPNRQFFVETLRVELNRAKRAGTDVALLFFDLDGFKDVNDSFGHEIGDKLLIEVGHKVKTYVREGDVVSRLGGDEFLVLLHDNPDEYMLGIIADRIIKGLSETIEIDGWQLSIGASIGIAKASQSNFNLSEFISNADLAMYRSKLEGKGKYTVFVETMMEDNKRKLQIANAIDNALLTNKFTLYYQPKVNGEGEVKSYEALIRWIDDELGFVSPAEFISISEQSGKIGSITSWVLKRAFEELTELQKKHSQPITVAINLSAVDIKNKLLLDEIKQLFASHPIDTSSIEFEVTESAYLENFEEANSFFNQLHDMGCTIALDDFGTGYSSLAYLTQINLDVLKIDKQFIDNIGYSENSNLVMTAIIDMARRLNLSICAEGVETREQADFLVKQGCDLMQGYYFGKPLPIKKISQEVTAVS